MGFFCVNTGHQLLALPLVNTTGVCGIIESLFKSSGRPLCNRFIAMCTYPTGKVIQVRIPHAGVNVYQGSGDVRLLLVILVSLYWYGHGCG